MSKTDLEIVLDYILDYGGLGYLPNMGDKEEGGSGDFAYEAALRLKKDIEVVNKMRIDARAKCQAAHSEDKASA